MASGHEVGDVGVAPRYGPFLRPFFRLILLLFPTSLPAICCPFFLLSLFSLPGYGVFDWVFLDSGRCVDFPFRFLSPFFPFNLAFDFITFFCW